MRALTDFAKALLASWLLVAAIAAMGWMLLGCAARMQETQVRRADSLGDVDAIADEQSLEGWRVVDVEALDGGAFAVVLVRGAK